MAIALLQSAILLGLGVLSFGVDLETRRRRGPGGGLPVIAGAAGMLLGGIAKTLGQAVAVAVPAGIVLGMLGGTMWPLSVVGPLMSRIGHLTPQAWAMDAWNQIINDGAGLAGIATELAVLTGFAVGLSALAVWGARDVMPAPVDDRPDGLSQPSPKPDQGFVEHRGLFAERPTNAWGRSLRGDRSGPTAESPRHRPS